MNPTSTSVNPYAALLENFDIGDDTTALKNNMKSARVQQMLGAAEEAAKVAAMKFDELNRLRTLLAQLGSATPIDSYRVALGTDIESGRDIRAELVALGYAVDTYEQYKWSYKTYDGQGTQVASADKVFANQDEMDMVSNAIPPSGQTGVKSGSFSYYGYKTNFTAYFDERFVTASKTQVDSAKSSMSSKVSALQMDAPLEALRAQAFADSVLRDTAVDRIRDKGQPEDPNQPGQEQRAIHAEDEERRRKRELDHKLELRDAKHPRI